MLRWSKQDISIFGPAFGSAVTKVIDLVHIHRTSGTIWKSNSKSALLSSLLQMRICRADGHLVPLYIRQLGLRADPTECNKQVLFHCRLRGIYPLVLEATLLAARHVLRRNDVWIYQPRCRGDYLGLMERRIPNLMLDTLFGFQVMILVYSQR